MSNVNRDLTDSGAVTGAAEMNPFNIVINGITRTCTIVKRQKNGRVVILAEGRRGYAAQRFTVEAVEIEKAVR